jgi:hypothetical protein
MPRTMKEVRPVDEPRIVMNEVSAHHNPSDDRPMVVVRGRPMHNDHSSHEWPTVEEWPMHHTVAMEARMAIAEMAGCGGGGRGDQGSAGGRNAGERKLKLTHLKSLLMFPLFACY